MDASSEKKILLEETGKTITIAIAEAPRARAVITLAHGAGSDMNHAFLRNLADAFLEIGITTIRFNFLYKEEKKKLPDRVPVASSAVRAVLAEAFRLYPSLPVFCAGKSFGGRMSSHTISQNCPDFVKGIIFFGFPLHPPKKPAVERAAHLADVPVPMLFLQGTRDVLAHIDLIEKVCASLPLASLEKFEGADHSFKGGKQAGIEQLVQRCAYWIDPLI
jgi:uncharacterized protein